MLKISQNPLFQDTSRAVDLAAFLNALMDEVWAKQKSELADAAPYEIIRHWQSDL